ncbi:MAG: RluA family pseudouridine synthase [Gammaproteobacteria bacterium]|nr:RluA family pseudouridine synthase [Gammaproteobacteria bacterium]
MSIDIIYQDSDILIVDKPGGIPSVPGLNPVYSKNIYHQLLDSKPPVYVVHRLDINTSGVIVFARTREAQINLHRQFAQRKVNKTYHAVVKRKVSSKSGEINLPIITDWPQKPLQKLCFINGKPSQTIFSVLAQSNEHSLLKLTPRTGRTHQLRIHLALIGHPIVGCNLYANSDKIYGRFTKPANMSNDKLFLHASEIQFYHPTSQKLMNAVGRHNFISMAKTQFKLNSIA